MNETLYEIPVNDIFDHPGECPVCAMKKKLDEEEVAFAMGPSYMEDDIRLTTDKTGFCSHHMQMLYDFENRPGLGLILRTHMQQIIRDVEKLQKKGRTSSGLFTRKTESPLHEYTERTAHSCFICQRIRDTFERYLVTTIYLYGRDDSFQDKFRNCNGFCLEHYGMLYEMAPRHLHGKMLEDFTADLNKVFLDHFRRMQEEIAWFVDKHDYRNRNADWKTSRDAIPRAMTKVNSIPAD